MESKVNFHEMDIDDRILKAIANNGWTEPTLVQERAIPLMLEGKDMLLRARTGSGKTAAFVIPVLQKILKSKELNPDQYNTKALILAPSKELCNQIYKNILQLAMKCSRIICCVDISGQIDMKEQKPLLITPPDIIVSTPARALLHLQAKNISLDDLQTIIVDEADLVFSFGYEEEIKETVKYLPKVYQAVLASATLSENVLELKKLLLHNAVILKLQEPDLAPLSQLTHYKLNAQEEDKAVILYCCFKLKLVKGKTIVFVNTVDKCYKLKLFLEQFGIHTCVLNSELPASCRYHTICQFNDNVYDIIIASDEKFMDEEQTKEETTNQTSKRKHDKEFGVARGIDFQFVSVIINYDFPLDVYSYIHRVGRTARGKNKGTAISFCNIREQNMLNDVEKYIKQGTSEKNDVFLPFNFKLEEVEGFRYRAKDAWRAVTKIAVREARLKEIKHEMLNSKKLKRYFQENPRDLLSLRHDKALHTVKLQDHMADVPDYMVPASLKEFLHTQQEEDENVKNSRKKDKDYYKKLQSGYKKYQTKKKNPLVGMEYTGLKKM
ncbi:probable ATP-dependent RNA helicase DDX56 [Adelges cooleyi]|uniref:probable ATP-dependent RNA helicase DDX56 n=1 Tax=Adelges cooleyi TaxID=133065 RepID=UPI002180303F|nr:probable ATP-dependent RNA helicase DDX56 [Adelges cooleyi]